MKVITEERLREWANNCLDDTDWFLDEICEYMMEESDTLTVSKLRPMCDAPSDDETILCVGDRYNTFLKVYFDGEYYKDDHNDIYDKKYFIGWIPMPIYKPEKG